MIEPDAAPRPNIGADGQVRQRKPLIVRHATADELAEHERVLKAIDKESKGACLWLPKPEAEAA
jgi:DNA polymerase-3 subunit epsilon